MTITKYNCNGWNHISAEYTARNYWSGKFDAIFRVDGYRDGDALIYDNGDGRERRAALQLASWARHLHGNAPSGTYYGRFIVTLSNGARVSLPLYL